MTIPSTPASADLAKGLTNLSKNFGRRSPYRFANWNIKNLPNPGTKLPDSAFKKLGRAANFFREGHYTLDQIKEIQKNGKKVKETADKVAKESGKIKSALDKLFDKIPGKDMLAKAAKVGPLFPMLLTLLASVALFAAQTKLTEFTQEMQIRATDSIADSLSKVLAIAIKGVQQARIANKAVETQKLENQRTRDRVYSLEKLLVPIREKANNALYEVRQGRKILDAGVAAAKKAANDALAEGRSLNTKNSNAIKALQADLNKYINAAKDGFQARAEATIKTLQKGLADAQAANKQTNQNIARANDAISLQSKLITSLQDAIKLIKPPTPTDTKTITNEVIIKVKELFNPQLNKIPAIENKVIELSSANSTLKINVESFKLAQSYIDAAQNNKSDAIAGGVTNLVTAINQQNDRISKIQNGVVTSPPSELAKAIELQKTSLEQEKKIVADLGGQLKTFKESVVDHDKKLAQLTNGINGLNTQNTQLKTDLGRLDTKIKEQGEVNIEGNKKLDQMLPLINLLPGLPGRVADNIKPSIPTVPQIGAEVGKQVCNSANGGCIKGALDKQTEDINNAATNNKNNLIDAFNTGSNAAQDAALVEVLARLGDKIPGGLSGKLVDGFKWLHLDRVLNILIFIATVQNHLMLSNDIGQTLLGAINNGLQLIGLKDDKGNAFDLGSVINSTAENLIKGIVGAENYAELSAAWAKASRIYQATANILNNFQGLASSILSGLELVAGQGGKIGNALKKAGQVLDDAYGWMNPQPKINRITNFLEGLQQGASTIQQVTQVPLDIISQTTELTNSTTELVKAWKEDDKPENKATPVAEPDKLKADEAAAAGLSVAIEALEADLEADE